MSLAFATSVVGNTSLSVPRCAWHLLQLHIGRTVLFLPVQTVKAVSPNQPRGGQLMPEGT